VKTFRLCVAEFLGTFYLCFAGIVAILSNTPAVGGLSGLLGVALPAAWGGAHRWRLCRGAGVRASAAEAAAVT